MALGKPIATINRQAVYSDKRILRIDNTRITFTDGSWCDVETGQVYNNGRGFLSIGSDGGGSGESGGDVTTTRPEHFRASALKVVARGATVIIEPDDRSDIEYSVTGPANELESITAKMAGATLVIEEAKGGGRQTTIGGVNIVGGIISAGDVSVVRGRFGSSVSISSGGSDVTITIKVPYGIPVQAEQSSGNTKIGRLRGPLVASVRSGKITAEEVTDLAANVQGSGDIEIREVHGIVTASVQGSGDAKIKGGDISYLSATVQGSGDIVVSDGSVHDANLAVQGSGDIRIRGRVIGNVRRIVQGSGDIKIG